MNVERLRAIQKHILEEPKRLHIHRWAIRPKGKRPEESELLDDRAERDDWDRYHRAGILPACDTVGCLAGWAVSLFVPNPENVSARDVKISAQVVLNLSSLQADLLFLPGNWPSKYANQLYRAGREQTVGHAEAVAAYIDWFIENFGPVQVGGIQ